MTAHVGPKQYIGVFVLLIVLTELTVLAAYQDFGFANTLIALGIAAVKATLVVLIFMHVRWSGPLVAAFSITGFMFVGIPFHRPLRRARIRTRAGDRRRLGAASGRSPR
jgi:caa(3)-type oxidase subunit IV